MKAMAQSTVDTKGCRNPGICQGQEQIATRGSRMEQEASECEFVRYPVSTRYVRPLMTSELLGTVQRQIMDLFDGRDSCKKLDSEGQFTVTFKRAESSVTDTEFGFLAEVLSCLGRWDGGSLKGVSAELRPRYRQAVKRQIARLLDTPWQGSSYVEGELGDRGRVAEAEEPAAVEFPVVSEIVEACLTSVSHDQIPAPTGGRDSEVGVSNQTLKTDIVQGPAIVRREPELTETRIEISIGSPGLEPGRTLPVVVDVVRDSATCLSGRQQGNFRVQPIMVDIVRKFSVLKTTKAPAQQCGRDEPCSDCSGSCRFSHCFPIWKSKPLRRFLRSLLSKRRHRRPIALPPLYRMPDGVTSERICCGRGRAAVSGVMCGGHV